MPELSLVAYQCPQCGASVEIPDGVASVNCSYCDAAIRIEDRPEEKPSAGRKPKPRRNAKKAFVPPRPATLTAHEFGRFDVNVLRQAIHNEPREAMRWLSLDERRAGLFLLRVVEEEKSRERRPACEESVLAALAEAAAKSLRERADPGLAAKAALRALDSSGAAGVLEAFVAVFDSEKSRVETYNAGCKSSLIVCSIEEGRQIDMTHDRGLLKRLDLRGKQDAFANGRTVQLTSDDAVVITSAGLAGDGRGWVYGQRSVYETLRRIWPGTNSAELVVALKDGFWADREDSSYAADPPVGDLLVVGVSVRSNVQMLGMSTAAVPSTRTIETERFDMALAPHADAFIDVRPLPDRKHMVVWLEGLSAEENTERGQTFADAAFAVMNKTPKNHDRPMDGGREGMARAKLADTDVRAMVLYLDDVHGKLGFYLRGWGTAFGLAPRSGTTTLQQFGDGGEAWPKPGGRLVFPGAMPFDRTIARLPGIAGAWSGGKASALYVACQQHEDSASSAAFLEVFMRSARTDVADADLGGVAAVTEKRID